MHGGCHFLVCRALDIDNHELEFLCVKNDDFHEFIGLFWYDDDIATALVPSAHIQLSYLVGPHQ